MFLNFGDDLGLVEPQCHGFGNEWVDRFAQPELAFFFGEDFTALDYEVAAASLAFDHAVVDQGRIGLGDRIGVNDQFGRQRPNAWKRIAYDQATAPDGRPNLVDNLAIDGDFPTGDYLNSEQNEPHYCTALCSTVGGLPVDVKLESEFI